MANQHHGINYIEFTTGDIAATKQFYGDVFGWGFVDYGPDYASFTGAGIDGGFAGAPLEGGAPGGSPLIVLYSRDLEASEAAVRRAGGAIVKPIFAFPGGRRFHFTDPGGNELAVWSE